MSSSHEDLANVLSEKRGSTFFVFTLDHRERYLASLDANVFDEGELRSYYNEFNETDEPTAGKAMLDGIKALRTAIAAVRQESIVLLHIG